MMCTNCWYLKISKLLLLSDARMMLSTDVWDDISVLKKVDNLHILDQYWKKYGHINI